MRNLHPNLRWQLVSCSYICVDECLILFEGSDFANDYNDLIDDILHESDDDSDDGHGMDLRRTKKGDDEGDDKEPKYMFFDFRRGPEHWPDNVELVDPKRADALLEKATTEANARIQLMSDDVDNKGGKAKVDVGGMDSEFDDDSDDEDQEESDQKSKLAANVPFRILPDGSHALVIEPGFRLKLDLSDLSKGGDATKEDRARKARQKKKRRERLRAEQKAWGYSDGGGMMEWKEYDGNNFKNKFHKTYLNTYTITMDLQLTAPPPREGLSLFQSSLIYTTEDKKLGKVALQRSDGECLVNPSGGVGVFGTFGDITKARVAVDTWTRVVITAKCTAEDAEKGELRTWVNAEPGIVVKDGAIRSGERFAIDAEGLFLFSSKTTSMMPGNVLVRCIRVDEVFSTDETVRTNRARDKVR